MIAALKRWIKNVKWLLNHPPTSVIGDPQLRQCDYCHQLAGREIGYWKDEQCCICNKCRKTVYDMVLRQVQLKAITVDRMAWKKFQAGNEANKKSDKAKKEKKK